MPTLFVRPMSALAARPLPGTDRASYPFWSPDSRWIGFFAGGKLKRVALTGGPPVEVCDAASGHGGNRKDPALATNKDGQFILTWTEGTGWNKGGTVAWQVYDREGKPLGHPGRSEGLPAWSMPAAIAAPDGTFRVIY